MKAGGSDIHRRLRRLLLPALLAAGALGILVLGFSLLSESPNFHGHAAAHWVMAIPVLFLALVVVRLPEARTVPRRMARIFVTMVLVVLPLSLLLEGIGAFASSGNGAFDGAIEPLHGVGEAGTLFATFALPLSVLILAVVYVLAGIRMLVRKSSSAY
jgi:hypothetical protein